MRVVDLTDGLAVAGARLMVGLGADVVRVEDGADVGRAERLHWHAGKRVVEVADEAALDELVGQADVVLESGPLAQLRGVRDAVSRWPDAVHVVVTPFGLTGPRRHWRADDLIIASAGGMTWLGGAPDGPPTAPPREQASQLAGTNAAIAALLGVLAKDRVGRGQLVDISAQEAAAATLETGAIAWIHGRHYPRRTGGVYGHVAHRIFAAADGYVAGGYSGSDRMWTDLLAWLVDVGEAADLTDERWSDPVLRWRDRSHVDEVVAAFAARRPAAAIAEEGRRRALPWAEVVAPARLVENPQLVDRKFFAQVDGVDDVGFPFESPGRPRPVQLDAPKPVETAQAWATPSARGRRIGEPATRPLDGLRVLDLTWVLAGPYATKVLAEHGADVIKIESKHRQDPTRFSPGMRLRPGAGFDEGGYFLNFNRGKRSVALNLRTVEGKELLRRLAVEADVVIENFSPGVLARWGLTYEQLAADNPDVIVVSMSGAGQTGPWRDMVTFADTLGALSGMSAETRDGDGPPRPLTFGLGDMVAGNAAVLAVLDRLATGTPGQVDLSQFETLTSAMGCAVIEARLGTGTRPTGPHGVYPTLGEDRWIAISAVEEAARDALVRISGDVELASWTATRDGHELARLLQERGVPAAVVCTGEDLVETDEHLAERGFYPVLVHPLAGPVRHEGVVARMSATPATLTTSAPLLGQDTDAVLTELLKIDRPELDELRQKGVLE